MNKSGFGFGYAHYMGWSKEEVNHLLPRVLNDVEECTSKGLEHVITFGPGNDPVNALIIERAKSFGAGVIAVDSDPKQLKKSLEIGVDYQFQGDLLGGEFIVQRKSDFIPLIFVLHNLPWKTIYTAVKNISSLCKKGTQVYCVDPYMGDFFINPTFSEDYKKKLNSFKEILDHTSNEISELSPLILENEPFKCSITLDYADEKRKVSIVCDNHPLNEYLNAFTNNGFAPEYDFVSYSPLDGQKPVRAWQIIHATKT